MIDSDSTVSASDRRCKDCGTFVVRLPLEHPAMVRAYLCPTCFRFHTDHPRPKPLPERVRLTVLDGDLEREAS